MWKGEKRDTGNFELSNESRKVFKSRNVIGISCDAGDAEQVEQLPGLMRLDSDNSMPIILINNAGIGDWKHFMDTNLRECESFVRVPFLAGVFMSRVLLPYMLKVPSATYNFSTIVNITSLAAFCAMPGAVVYQAARHAVRGFNDALAADLRGTPVAVRHVSLGSISDTAYFDTNAGGGGRSHFPLAARAFPDMTAAEAAVVVVDAIRGHDYQVIEPAFFAKPFIAARTMLPDAVDKLLSYPVASGDRA